MFGLNKKLKQKTIEVKKSKESIKNGKENSNSKLSAIPDLICKSFADGCLVLGCVHDIKNSELVVSLPGIGNFGYIKLNNISNIYTDLLKNVGTTYNNKKQQTNEVNTVNTLLEMYNKGDLVRCKVLSYTDKKLYLSIQPDQVNSGLTFNNLEENMIISGAIKTKEDHGYTVDLGIEDLSGFYKTNDSCVNLPLGQCCLFKITNKPSKRSISLKLCDSNESTFYELKTKYQFDTYLPGAKLKNCVIEKITKNGLKVNISNQLFGYIHSNHIPLAKRASLTKNKKDFLKELDDKNKSNMFSNGDKVNATIIFINPYSKVIYLSLLTHLSDSTKPAKISKLFLNGEDSLKLGQVIGDAQVTIHTFKGVYVKFNGTDSKQITGFIPKRHLFNENKENGDLEDEENEENVDGVKLKKLKKDAKNMDKAEIEKLFPLNSKLKARVYDFSLIEDMILLSCRSSILNASFMNYDELSVGQVVKCTVRSINPNNGGVNVKLSDFITGFIPKIHTGDIPLSENMLSRKLKPGTELKCKIIQLNPIEKRCVLTAKKSLIKSKLTLIDSFGQVKKGLETYGVVISIHSYGLLLGFLNDLKGLLPKNQISTSSTLLKSDQDLKELYYIGQLIKCSVMDFNKEKQQIKLSLIMDTKDKIKTKMNVAQNGEDNEQKKFEMEYEIGDLIESANIIQVNEENHYFRLKLPIGAKHGIIYKNHLSDLECLNDALFDYYKQTLKINNLMITQYSESQTEAQASKPKSCHYLTLKASLTEYYTKKITKTKIPKSFEDLKSNEWHHGWIKKILSNGLLVELPYNIVGFCSIKELKYANELKSTNINGLSHGQSLLVRVNKIFTDKKKFVTNVRTRHDLLQKNTNELEFMLELFKSLILNMHNLTSYFYNKTQINVTNEPIVPSINGNILIEKLISKVRIGSLVKVAVKNFNRSSGQIECVILDDDQENSMIYAYAFADSNANESELSSYKSGTKLDALVLAFDPLAKVFCLTIDKKKMKTYGKNFDSSFRSHVICKRDQSIKAEIVFVSQWFCIVGLKAHALGKLAIMPLFRNDFTQLNTFSALNESNVQTSKIKLDAIDSKIKQQQVIAVSSASLSSLLSKSNSDEEVNKNLTNGKPKTTKSNKEDKKFSYFYVGKMIRVLIKEDCSFENSKDLDYSLVVNDSTHTKRKKKQLLRELAILNENHANTSQNGLKRKVSDYDETILVKKKLILKGDSKKKRKLSEGSTNGDHINDVDYIEIVTDVKKVDVKRPRLDDENLDSSLKTKIAEFPWEVKDFDQFEQIINGRNENESLQSENKDIFKAKKLKKDDKDKSKTETSDYPQSPEEFDRLVAANPDSSIHWIKYMIYYLNIAEVEKARAIAQQALKKVSYREDSERLNIWVALLNLENMHGTQTDIDHVFNKANQTCDSFKIHCHMAEIYFKSNKLQEAEEVYMKMSRKFSKTPDVWVKYGVFHYRNSNCELARKLLIKSFNSLDKRDHIEMVNKFAQLEFKYGDIERAKTMYDSLLFTYPNRTDIWSVYIDMLVKHNKFDDVRQVFNRIIKLGLTAKRMKFIFKKYMDFEKQHGSDELVEKVKELAAEYVEKNNGKENDDDKLKDGSSIEDNLKKSLKNLS